MKHQGERKIIINFIFLEDKLLNHLKYVILFED